MYAKILTSLNYTFDVASSQEELEDLVTKDSYKLILFDKELEKFGLAEFTSLVHDSNKTRGLNSYLVQINDPSSPEKPGDHLLVDETIQNVINKDLLRLVFEKFLQG